MNAQLLLNVLVGATVGYLAARISQLRNRQETTDYQLRRNHTLLYEAQNRINKLESRESFSQPKPQGKK
jgi:uncharacterized membrane-anchored protein YhcB (DUF1043 family)